MLLRAFLLLGIAAPLAAVDLAHKTAAETPYWGYHVRSGAWIALAVLVFTGCLLLVRIPALAVAGSAGVLAGGVAGNAVSAVRWDAGIPNPLVVDREHYAIAFNLADVFTLCGILLLMLTLMVVTVRYRQLLLPPRAVWRNARQRLRR